MARLPRAVRVRVGPLQARLGVVRPGRRGPGRADPSHPRSDSLLRRPRLRRRSLSAAGPFCGPRRVPPQAGRGARSRAAGPGRPLASGGVGVLRPLLALHAGPDPPSAGGPHPPAPHAPRACRSHLLALAAPLVWVLSDLAITGDPLWSLTNTRHTADALHRVTGIANAPEYIPRRIGEILRPPVLVGAALGGVLSLLWLRRRALLGAAAGVLAVVVFAAFAAAGLPINTRYAFLAAAILSVFCGAGSSAGRALTEATPGDAGGWRPGPSSWSLSGIRPGPVPLGPP